MRRSESLSGTRIEVSPDLLTSLKLKLHPFWADYNYLAGKHPKNFSDGAAARDHVEQVLSRARTAVPQRSGNIDLIARTPSDHKLIGFRAELRGGHYHVRTAYVLSPGQFERMKEGATRAGMTVIELAPDSSSMTTGPR